MTNKQKIAELVGARGRVTSAEIMVQIGVSKQYVGMVMSDLIANKQVVKFGKTRNAFYVSQEYLTKHPEIIPTLFKKTYKNQALEEHIVILEIEEKFPAINMLAENVRSIFIFAFSEMLNNAIEHSGSKNISVEVSLRENKLSFVVADSGIGVFRNIMKKKHLRSEVEAIQDLLKGKTTTMPKSHSGEGIFFTSKASDTFLLDSFGHQLSVHTLTHEVAIHRTSTIKRGTRVTFQVDSASDRHLNDVFKKYTNLSVGSDYGFDKTEVRVKLYITSGVHVSRSQARRILTGLDVFQIILLDFEKVPMVGQAFADEIYRVFQQSHLHISIQEENMSEGVRFMVERAKNEARKSS